jgi:hypothetical protein
MCGNDDMAVPRVEEPNVRARLEEDKRHIPPYLETIATTSHGAVRLPIYRTRHREETPINTKF